jgi:23S rRNA pseudouridine1911/1915/1917 synthase
MEKSTKTAAEVFSAACYSPSRLDQFLATQEGVKSRSEAARLIEAGMVTVNDKTVKKPSLKLDTGETVTWSLREAAAVPEDIESVIDLPVLYEDDSCIVINKPAGFAVHPGSGMKTPEETILGAAKALFVARKLPYSPAEVLVHRLDKDTTGCLLLAKTPEAHAKLQKAFADRTVKKTYLALVAGTPNLPVATIDAPIGRHGTERTKMSIHKAVKSRTATTTYHTIGSVDGVSLLECDLHTGRTHQIRVHLSSIGHPVLGDETYGNNASHTAEGLLGIESLCLHAKYLSFMSGKKKVHVEAPLPEKMKRVLKELGLEE